MFGSALALLSACRVQEPLTKAGVDTFEAGQFKDASAAFDQALMNAPSSEAHLGKASATYQLGEHDEAAEQFRRVLSTTDDGLKARAWFDLGVNEAKAGRLDGAIDAFRRSLELVPGDLDARYDLEWALMAKKQQEQQKKDQKDGDKSDDQKPDGDKSEDKQDAADQKQDPSKQGEQKPDEQKAGGSDGSKKDEPQQGKEGAGQQPQPGEEPKSGEQPQAGGAEASKNQPPPKPMNAQKAAAVLDALQGGEKSLQMWRFQKQTEKQKGGDVAQDW
jgi:tetratricopeptide (TPR) repeat protein